jgi:hypothetical protein
MGIRFVRLAASLVENDLASALDRIAQAALSHPSPQPRERGLRERGGG